ncbi:hypothetical protein NM688_g1598 [Phlebia brevispora]|uniref:Uncharacterized protein n=1 Tax=Phlebia brevispora TaxID=194682 RepID=A0ACC1TB22_9APHY|nr:hypothetical protein NM688_g1598 [Phlebia brevispora]
MSSNPSWTGTPHEADGTHAYKCDCTMFCRYLKQIGKTTYYLHRQIPGNTTTHACHYIVDSTVPAGLRLKIKFSKKCKDPNGRPYTSAPYLHSKPRKARGTGRDSPEPSTSAQQEGYHSMPLSPESQSGGPSAPHVTCGPDVSLEQDVFAKVLTILQPEPPEHDIDMHDMGVPYPPSDNSRPASPMQLDPALPEPGCDAPPACPHGPDEWVDMDEEGSGAGERTVFVYEIVDEDTTSRIPMPAATLEDLRITQLFIEGVRNAMLDTDKIAPEVLAHLRNSPKEQLDLSCPILRLSLNIYLGIDNCSNDQYNVVRESLVPHNIQMLSYDQVKCRTMKLSSMYPVYQHLPRLYRPIQRLGTLSKVPQLQALHHTSEGASAMDYRVRSTARLKQDLAANSYKVPVISDFLHGKDYINAVHEGKINDDHIMLLLSLDGAQLYAHKESDCWIYIWVVLDHSPNVCYCKKHVLVGGVIPGPCKPKDINSFLFPGMHHLSALMKEGLLIWDSAKHELRLKRPFFAFGAADGPGMSYLNGAVGHKGAQGCRLFCPQKGWLKPNKSWYYPACLKPLNYDHPGSSHNDIDLFANPDPNTPSLEARYEECLHTLLSSCTPAQYHLLLKLWRGVMKCDKDNDRSTWDWAVLQGNIWKAHGQAVGDTQQYLPNSFDRPLCDLAEKLNSGYKAIEFLMYLFGLGLAMLGDILPEKYWQNYCKLVRGIQILHQRSIALEDLVEAHKLLIEFCDEFKQLYYQHDATHIHFVQPHIVLSQWTMERLIGELMKEMRQPSNPYQNLAQRALRWAQVSALKAMHSDLECQPMAPRGTADLGDHAPYLDRLKCSYNMVWSCQHEHVFAIIDAKQIRSVVAAVPHTRPDRQLGDYNGHVFMVEKMGLDIMPMSGAVEADTKEQEGNEGVPNV